MSKVQFAEPLKFLNVVGLSPLNGNKFSKLRNCVSILIILGTLIPGLLELFLNFEGMETCARASESLVVQFQLIIKITVLIVYKHQIAQLMANCSNFWQLDMFKGTERIHKLLRYFLQTYKVLMVLMTILYILRKPLSQSDKPLAIFYGENKGLSPISDSLVFVLHSFSTVVAFFVVVGFDGLLFYFVGHVLSELKMVKYSFLQYKEENFVTTLKHHQSVLRFVQNMNQVYSTILLHQHVSCLFGICFGLFLMSQDGLPPDFGHIVKYVPYVVCFITQTFTFCFIGSLMMSWSLEIPDAIFHNDWSKSEVYRYKLEQVIAIKRAQRAAALRLGGFGNLDLESFAMVINNSFNFFTFINTMHQK